PAPGTRRLLGDCRRCRQEAVCRHDGRGAQRGEVGEGKRARCRLRSTSPSTPQRCRGCLSSAYFDNTSFCTTSRGLSPSGGTKLKPAADSHRIVFLCRIVRQTPKLLSSEKCSTPHG